MTRFSSLLAGFGAALFASACTVSQTPAPSLTGPSEFALSVDVTASPDTIAQDGQSVSTVAVVARGPNGEPRSNVAFRLEIQVEGEPSDYGTLSMRSVVTGSDGRATAVYKSPAPPPAGAVAAGSCDVYGASLAGRCVRIMATPIGSGFDTAVAQSAQIHLIPTAVIVPPSATPVPAFNVSPAGLAANSPVQFDASTSCAGALVSGACPASNGVIVSYAWNFGDGGTASGKTATHSFGSQRTYLVTLTVTNDRGLSASTTRSIDVGAGAVPTASFSASPTAPIPNQDVHFDATVSRAGAGHTLVRFVWNFGDGTERVDSNSPIVAHKFAAIGSYVVTLNIADEVGQVATTTRTINVGVEEEEEDDTP